MRIEHRFANESEGDDYNVRAKKYHRFYAGLFRHSEQSRMSSTRIERRFISKSEGDGYEARAEKNK